MHHDNRDSGCNAVVAILLLLLVGLAILVLVGLFYFRSAALHKAAMARDLENVTEQQARAAEVFLAQDGDSVDAEVNPATVVTIELDAEGIVTVDGVQVDLGGLRSRLTNAASTQFHLNVDDLCRFEHVSTVFDEVGIERPALVPTEE